MERIGIRQLQQNAAAAVRRVQRGEPIEVTERGHAVAVLTPLAGKDPLRALEAAGRLTRADADLLELGNPLRLPSGKARPWARLAAMRENER